MHDILAKTTISVGLIASAAWTAFLAFEIFRLLASSSEPDVLWAARRHIAVTQLGKTSDR
jgi:hypothetical protein